MEMPPGKIPEDAKFINIKGKKGESFFHQPVIWFVQAEFKRIKEQYEHYQKLIEGTKEERLLVLIGALSIEEALDAFLTAYIPSYSLLEKNGHFFLSMKIDVARCLCLIPKHLLNAADIVRTIRNEFAHQLSIDCFESLDSKFKNKLTARFKEIFPDTDPKPTVKDTYVSVIEGIIIGLGIYASHLKAAREYIYGEDFSKQLARVIKDKAR